MSHPIIKKKIIQAINDLQSLEIIYLGGSNPGEKRMISPKAILNEKNNNILIKAYCHKRGRDLNFNTNKMKLPGDNSTPQNQRKKTLKPKTKKNWNNLPKIETRNLEDLNDTSTSKIGTKNYKTLKDLFNAIRYSKEIEVTYNDGSHAGELRRIKPHVIWSKEGFDNYYVDAYCNLISQPISFNVSKIDIKQDINNFGYEMENESTIDDDSNQNLASPDIVRSKLDILREKLIDLSMRNKNLNFNLVSRGRQQIRIIDEVPDLLLEKISTNGMQIISLPPLPKIPKDETTQEFQSEYEIALIADEEYLAEYELGQNENKDAQYFEKIERKLRDKIRLKLDLGPLEEVIPSPTEWARKNDINPVYELPTLESVSGEEKKYTDNKIQTLLMPEDCLKTCKTLATKYRESINERGVNDLRMAFGFLEFKNIDQEEKKYFAPILTQTINIEEKQNKRKKGGFPSFTISSPGEQIEVNNTLRLYLKDKHDISIPHIEEYLEEENFSIDKYLKDFEEAISGFKGSKVKRFVNLGTFSFSKSTMYQDLDSNLWPEGSKPEDNIILQSFFGGANNSSDNGGNVDYADEFEVDKDEFLTNVTLVKDADASQISTIIDGLKGKNLAIQGPPGTGKSQTITNLIAGFLYQGKTVLFLAQKMAALRVVEKRLDEIGLGEFILEMHSRKANKQSIKDSIKKRMDLSRIENPKIVDELIENVRSQTNQLNNYAYLIKEPICELGYNYHELTYKYHRSKKSHLVEDLKDLPTSKEISLTQFEEIVEDLENYKNKSLKLINQFGKIEDNPFIDFNKALSPFEKEDLNKHIDELDKIISNQKEVEKVLDSVFDIKNQDLDYDKEFISELSIFIENFKENIDFNKDDLFFNFFDELNDSEKLKIFDNYTNNLSTLIELEEYKNNLLSNRDNDELLSITKNLIDFIDRNNFLDIQKDNIQSLYSLKQDLAQKYSKAIEVRDQFAKIVDIFSSSDSEAILNLDIDKNSLLQTITFILHRLSNTSENLSSDDYPTLVNEEILSGNDEVDLDREIFKKNITRITYTLLPDFEKYPEKIKKIKQLEERLNNKISLQVSEDYRILRKSGQILTSTRWFDIITKLQSSYKNAKELYFRYGLEVGLKDREMGNVLLEAASYFEQINSVSKLTEFEENFGKIWKKENTEFLKISSYLRFLKSFNNVSNYELKDFFMRNILDMDSQKLRSISQKIEKIKTVNFFSDLNILDDFNNIEKYISSLNKSIIELDGVILDSKKIKLCNSDDNFRLKFRDIKKINNDLEIWNKFNNTDIKNNDIVEILKSEENSIKVDGYSIYDLSLNTNKKIILTYQQFLKISRSFDDHINYLEAKYMGLDKKVIDNFLRIRPFFFKHSLKKDFNILIDSLKDHTTNYISFSSILNLISELLRSDLELKLKTVSMASDWSNKIKKDIADFDLDLWLDYLNLKNRFKKVGILDIFVSKYNDAEAFKSIVSDFKHYIYRSIIKDFYENNPSIKDFSGNSLNETRKKLDQYDQQLKKYNVEKISSFLSTNIIPRGQGGKKVRDYTDLTLLQHYKDKQLPFGRLSLRKVINNAENAIKALKPCWMMSPISVADNLRRGKNIFDVIIIDEASQMPPEDAIGAFLRAKQVIVVGDQMQLPPTNVFTKTAKADDDDFEDSDESILDQAVISFSPIRLLNWHYRSEHESLISFSNHQFYENKLKVFPSPNQKGGIKYDYLPDAYYEQNGLNSIEADRVVEKILFHMNNFPDESLIAVAVNRKQKDLIEQKLLIKSIDDEGYKNYITKWANSVEEFEIKNLETVQGDERDVIIISTVYGKDIKAKKVFQRFGPINSNNGHRRLNVLFTRARKRVDVVTSLDPADIIVTENSSRGLQAFKGYLEYAKSGNLPMTNPNKGEPDNDFERSIRDALEVHGFETFCQVGVAGFSIDIGVRDPLNKQNFIAGIECDGATYHSSKSARDRDILRQEILENLGWKIHRVWSTDWFNNPTKTTEIMVNKINEWIDHSRENKN